MITKWSCIDSFRMLKQMGQKLIHKGNVIIITNSITKIIIINAIQTITATIFPPQHSSTINGYQQLVIIITLVVIIIIPIQHSTPSSSPSLSPRAPLPHHHHHYHRNHNHYHHHHHHLYLHHHHHHHHLHLHLHRHHITLKRHEKSIQHFAKQETNERKKSLTFKPNLLTHLLHLLPGRFFL